MREFLTLAIHVLVTSAELLRLGGVRAVAAESLLLKHQLLISNRFRQRAPNLTSVDRFMLGLTTLLISPGTKRSIEVRFGARCPVGAITDEQLMPEQKRLCCDSSHTPWA